MLFGCPSSLSPFLFKSSSVLIENWCPMLFWQPSSSAGGFLFNSYWKLMPYAQMAVLLLWWFLIQFFLFQFLLKTDAKCSSGYSPPLVVDSHSTLIEIWYWMLFCILPSFQFLLKTDGKCSSGCRPPPLVYVYYSILLQFFLIRFLWKTGAQCSSAGLPPLVLDSRSILIGKWC